MSKLSILSRGLVGAALFAGSYCTYQGYTASVKPSQFQLAVERLKLSDIGLREIPLVKKEEALLNIFYMAGYLKPKSLWQDINKIGCFKDPHKVFQIAMQAIRASGADQDDISKFDPKILRKNLFKTDEITEKEAADLLVYIAQHAFNRAHGQERNELKPSVWMADYKDLYFEQARSLGLIDRITWQAAEHDEAWIAGASRVGVMARVIDYDWCLSQGLKIKGSTKVLAGGRPLWAEIDGISPDLKKRMLDIWQQKKDFDSLTSSLLVGDEAERTEEGSQYIRALAAKYGVRLDNDSPMIVYASKEKCPAGFFPGRHYPKYALGETKRLTETLMSEDVLSFFGFGDKVSIIDTEFSGTRPTTASTARDAIADFMARVKKGDFGSQKEFWIVQQSNNPYIERQALAAQLEVNKFLKETGLSSEGYKVRIDGIGFSNKQDVPVIHSEFGALMGVLWMMANDSRSGADIMYQSRNKDLLDEPVPDLQEENWSLVGDVQRGFDEILE